MKRLLIICTVALSLGGCNTAGFFQDVRDVKQQALEVIAKIRAGYVVVAAEIDATVSRVCSALPAVNATLMSVQSTIPNPGPRTANAVREGNAAMAGAAAACNEYASTADKKGVLKRLWNAYNAGEAAAAVAHAAGGA